MQINSEIYEEDENSERALLQYFFSVTERCYSHTNLHNFTKTSYIRPSIFKKIICKFY